ncbi:MAG TPA: MBL fold metallo-hydrolase [Myxococcota bacterium]|nr:MBL fold metallo-hydrolase [Myxococcota bacterium]
MTLLIWTIGDVKITRIPEVTARLVLAEFFPEATPEAVALHRSWLEPHFLDAEGGILLSIHGLVVDTGELRILVDTCLGPHAIPGFEDLRAGAQDFPGALAAAGYPREAIDIVMCTHLHFDHVGWNVMREGDRLVPAFPNARYLFARAEWEHWSAAMGAETYAPTIDAAVRPLVDAGLADLVEPDHKLCDSVRLVPTAGHTPGHVSVEISSQGERAFITGDMTHHPVQWAEPDWKMNADTDSAAAAATRRRIANALAGEPVLVIGTHYAPPCAGHLVRGPRGVWFRARH